MNVLTPRPSDHMRIVAVIQARMGSTRLPGKVLKPVAGQPLLWHVIHRLRRSHFIEQVAIATSINPLDDAIVEFGREHGVPVIRGAEDNVLTRFARAAELLDADIIVRVNADAPFIDAGFVDHLIAAMLEEGADYVLLQDGAITAHQGVDPFSRRALDKLMMDAADDAIAREHVTGYFKLHPDFVRIAYARPYPRLARDGARLTVDTPDDLAFVETVHERLAVRAGEASLEDLLSLLDREPGLRGLNAHVRQKSLTARGGLALIRCDGGGPFGYGHVKRMVALAKSLRDREGIGALFAINGSDDAHEPIRAAGFEALTVDRTREEAAMSAIMAARSPDMLICDCRDGVDRAALARLAEKVLLTAIVDDGSDRRLAADLAYYPPLPQVSRLDWSGSYCVPRVGWEWALLGQAKSRPAARAVSSRPNLLVAMGGSDPMALTLKAASALAGLDPAFRARFVIGPGVRDKANVARAIVGLAPHFETLEGADDLAIEYASADVALCAFGVTAYELAAYGVPALYLCLTEDHALSASAFEQAGMGISLGLAAEADDDAIASAVWSLLTNSGLRRDMQAAGLMTIDGGGASRIAADLAQALVKRRVSKPLVVTRY